MKTLNFLQNPTTYFNRPPSNQNLWSTIADLDRDLGLVLGIASYKKLGFDLPTLEKLIPNPPMF